MVLYESALLGLFGGIIGVTLGADWRPTAGSQTPAIRGLLQPDLGLPLLGLSVVIALVVGIVSGLYPAWRSSRLMPSACPASWIKSRAKHDCSREFIL